MNARERLLVSRLVTRIAETPAASKDAEVEVMPTDDFLDSDAHMISTANGDYSGDARLAADDPDADLDGGMWT